MTCPAGNEHTQTPVMCDYYVTGIHCEWYGQEFKEFVTESEKRHKKYYRKWKELRDSR